MLQRLQGGVGGVCGFGTRGVGQGLGRGLGRGLGVTRTGHERDKVNDKGIEHRKRQAWGAEKFKLPGEFKVQAEALTHASLTPQGTSEPQGSLFTQAQALDAKK